MFEKEAFEEWKSEQYKDQSTEERLEFVEHLHTFPKYFEKAFKDGYNKANEWHYVKDELPPENVPLNIITFDKNKKKRLWEGEYKGGKGQYWTGYFNHFIDVPYAWKEIVLPKEIKEND